MQIKNRINYIELKQYLERKGWNVITFNTLDGDDIVTKLKLQKQCEISDGFVFNRGVLKYVFINGNLNEQDKVIVLIHEMGHIELAHDLGHTSKVDELNAWHFAYRKFYGGRIAIKWLVLALIICALSVTNLFQFYTHRQQSLGGSDAVYVTESGGKYHRADCYYIDDKQSIEITKKEAEKKYEPCKVCKP